MALTSASTLANAIAQYQDNLAYWESATKAASLYEAVLFLLQAEVQSYSIAGRSVQRRDLEVLRDSLQPRVENSTLNTRRKSFTQARAV